MSQILIMLLEIVQLLLQVMTWIIIIQAVLSWLIAFNVINTYNEFVRTLWTGLSRVTAPVYRPIRRILPDFGALDVSPMVALLLITILDNIVIPRLIFLLAGGGA